MRYNELIECILKHGLRGYCSKIASECFGQVLCDSMLLNSLNTNVQELSAWLDSYINKALTEDELKNIVSEFKRKYTSIVGATNSDNRGKQRQEVGHA